MQALLSDGLNLDVAVFTEAKVDDEWRNGIAAKLFSTPQGIFIDNLTRRLDSGSLAAALTSTSFRGPRDPQLRDSARAGVVPLGRDRQQPQPLRRAMPFANIGTQIHQAKRCVHRIKAVAEGDQTAMPLQSQT